MNLNKFSERWTSMINCSQKFMSGAVNHLRNERFSL